MNNSKRLNGISDLIIEEVLSMTDDEVDHSLLEHGITKQQCERDFADTKANAAVLMGKSRLQSARDALDAKRQQDAKGRKFAENLKTKGKDVQGYLVELMTKGLLPGDLTVAFREGKDISEDELEGILEDLIDLGVIKDDKPGSN